LSDSNVASGYSSCAVDDDCWSKAPTTSPKEIVQVDTNTPELDHEIFIIGTGQEKPVSANRYLGTVYDAEGFVWHIYE
jgi:hypothetical protein